MSDLSVMEKLVFGEDATRDPVTHRIFEHGLHALPRDVQAAAFLREANAASDMPKEGERCVQTSREFQTGAGCLGKAAQTAIFLSELSPTEKAKRATAAAALNAAPAAGNA